MKTYALYCNGKFVVAKPLYSCPSSPEDFGVAYLPTSCYDIFDVVVIRHGSLPNCGRIVSIEASIDVGAIGVE